ncbi:hypothetical protein LWC34_06440 [Kibdelosporangium philippinense]|uniref:Uncharacterized protein n=1 Tax=Kibdelosporangium philippinense TaxID=211113 RepID=A0ABS8Z5Z5_9PSEU|nr:hypothetical protein [Kibdelosporangium philippinense]MCE7002469.1 hypothetical protein [Kibdelosporangium philippinense]
MFATIITAVVTASSLTVGSAVAAEPSTIEQDVAQLVKDVEDAENGHAQDIADPFLDVGIGQNRDAGCTEGALVTHVKKLAARLTPLEQQAVDAFTSLGRLYVQGVVSEEQPQAFGSAGQYSARADATIRNLRSFWDIEGRDIQLVAWKGTDLGKQAKMKLAFEIGMTPVKADKAAANARKVLFELPAMRKGRNPLLTMNALSTPPGSVGGKRVLLGDGLLDVASEFGFGDVSVETIVGHEYGHQLNYANDNHPNDEARELGPDAFGGYFVAHAKGRAFNASAQRKVGELNASIGDCDRGHGTPNQREAAAVWGQKQAALGEILPSATIIARFTKDYPGLVTTGSGVS